MMGTKSTTNVLKCYVMYSFQLCCIALAIYMAVLQYNDYQSNQDSSSVTYKRFENENENIHLTFTVCLHGDNGEIFKNAINCSSPCSNESHFVEHELECEETCKYNEYFKFISGNDGNSSIKYYESYEREVVDFKSIILDFHSVTKEGRTIRKFDPNLKDTFKTVFAQSYRDPWNVCFTKKDNPENKDPLKYDFLELKDGNNFLSITKYAYYIYVHQKGQLIRRLGAPNQVLKKKAGRQDKKQQRTKKKVKKGKDKQVDEITSGYSTDIHLRLKSAEVLRKRPDAMNPCNNSLSDEDAEWIKHAVNTLECIPAFMNTFGNNEELNEADIVSQMCRHEQYARYATNYNPEYYFSKIGRLYTQPCLSMSYDIRSTLEKVSNSDLAAEALNAASRQGDDSPTIDSKDLVDCSNNKVQNQSCFIKVRIKVEYVAEDYKETQNYRAFGALSLLSQIGGCIGMFLGYSLLHLPELIDSVMNWIRQSLCFKRKKLNKTLPEEERRE